MGLEQRPYIGTWKLNDKEIIQHTPDCLVYLNGDVSIPGGFDASKSQRRINIQPYITSVSVDGGTSPAAASANISLSIPVHSKDPFVRDAQFILHPGLEVHIYMRGYFPVRGLWRDETEQVQQEDGTYEDVYTKFKGEVVKPIQATSKEPFPLPESVMEALHKRGYSMDGDKMKNAAIVYEVFRQAGWSPSGALAFVNQAMHESSFNPEAYTARALGMFQAVPSKKYTSKPHGHTQAVKDKYRSDWVAKPGQHTTKSGAKKTPQDAVQDGDVDWTKDWDAQDPYLSAGHEVAIAGKAQKKYGNSSAERVGNKIYWSGLGGGQWHGFFCQKGKGGPPSDADLANTRALILQYKESEKIAAGIPADVQYEHYQIAQAQEFLGKYSSKCLAGWNRGVSTSGKIGKQYGHAARLSRYGARQRSLNKLAGGLAGDADALNEMLIEQENTQRAAAAGAAAAKVQAPVGDISQPIPHRKRPTDDILAYPYYAAFHGVVTQCDLAYSGGFQTATINCASMLHFWQYQNMSTNASYMGARPAQSKLRMSMVGNNFTGQHPYQIIYTLFHDTAGSAGGVGWALSSKTNQKASIHGQSLFSLNMQYWEKRFSSGRMMKLRLHGANGQLFNSAQSAFLGRLSTRAIGRVFRSRWPGANVHANTASDLGGAAALGLMGNPKQQRGKSGLSDVAAKRTDPTIQGTVFVARESDSYRSKDHSLNIFEMIPYVSDLSQIGQINFFESTYESKNDIIENICNLTSFEFFQDVDGDFVFKPPMYNMDTSSSRVYRIEDIDIIDISFSEKEPQATYITGKNAGFKNLLGTGIENEWGVRGQYIDYRLVAQFGWRPTSFETTYLANPRSLYFACVNRLDILNVEMTTASCTIPIRPEIRVGYPFYIRYMDAFYYCNSFSHSWSAGSRCTTQLQLVGKRAKFFAPGVHSKIASAGVEAINLGNTILPPTPLTMLAGDQTAKLTGFPNVVMALDPFKINPLFFIIGADMDDMTDPQVLVNVFEWAAANTSQVVERRGDDYILHLPDTRAGGGASKDLKITLDPSAGQGDGVSKPFNVAAAAKEHEKAVQGEIGAAGTAGKAKEEMDAQEEKLAELESQYDDVSESVADIERAIATLQDQVETGALKSRDAQRGVKGEGGFPGINALKKQRETLFKGLNKRWRTKPWSWVQKKLQAKIQGQVVKIQSLSERQKAASAETEIRIASNEEVKTFLEILQAIGGNFFKSGRESSMWSDLASSHNLLDMLSDRKASFTNGTIPGHYRYFSSSHPDPLQQGSGFRYEATWDDGSAGIKDSGAFDKPITGTMLLKKKEMETQLGIRPVDTELKIVEGGIKKGLYIISPTGKAYTSPWGQKAEQVGSGNRKCFRLLTPTAAIRTIEFQVNQVIRKGHRPTRMKAKVTTPYVGMRKASLGQVGSYLIAQLAGLTIEEARKKFLEELAPQMKDKMQIYYPDQAINVTEGMSISYFFPALWKKITELYLANSTKANYQRWLTWGGMSGSIDEAMDKWGPYAVDVAGRFIKPDSNPIIYARLLAKNWTQAAFNMLFSHVMAYPNVWTHVSLGLPVNDLENADMTIKQVAATKEISEICMSRFSGAMNSISAADNDYMMETTTVTYVKSKRKSRTRMIQTPVFPVSDASGYTVVGSYAYGRGLTPYPDSELDQLAKADPQGAVDPITLRNYVDRVLRGKRIYEQVTVTHKGIKVSKKQAINPKALQKELIKEIRENFTNQQLIDMGIAKMNGTMIEFNLRNWISDNRDSTFQLPVTNAAFSLADMGFHDILPNVDELRSAEQDVLISALVTDFATIVGSQNLDKMIEFANAVADIPLGPDGTGLDLDLPSQNLFFSMLDKAGDWRWYQDLLRGRAMEKPQPTGAASIVRTIQSFGLAHDDPRSVFNTEHLQQAMKDTADLLSEVAEAGPLPEDDPDHPGSGKYSDGIVGASPVPTRSADPKYDEWLKKNPVSKESTLDPDDWADE